MKNRIFIPILAVVIMVSVAFKLHIVTVTQGTNSTAASSAGLSGQKTDISTETAKANVDNSEGAPVDGRDPAAQMQTTLASASSAPTPTGKYTDTPAAGLTGTTVQSADTSAVRLGNAQAGINAAGCFVDYGIPGEQCMPADMADSMGRIDCTVVRIHFPKGLVVSGTDRFGLDRNGDKTACGPND